MMYRSELLTNDKLAVICTTLRETLEMKKWLDEVGWKSCDGNPFNDSWINAVRDGDRLCDLKRGKRGSRDFYIKNNYKIVQFSSLSKDIGFEF